MKTTVSVNIGGLAFYIDDDAYEILKKYMRKIELQYAKEEGYEEIIADIEARVADLFRERVTAYKQSVTRTDVVEVIGIMGDPEDFENAKSDARTSLLHVEKSSRMYRDVDHRIIGGVCAGLAAYWSIDTTLVRALFILFAFAGGAALVIYIILWIVIPAALTTAQKLEMKGEPVNVDNIKRTVKDEFEKVKQNFKK